MARKNSNNNKEARAKRRSIRAGQDKDTRTKGSGKPRKSKLREWIEALVFAVIVMVIVRTLFFDLFRIPTPSMEKSLLVGDYLFVSKLHYGTRTPMTIGIPFTDIYLPGFEIPSTRLPGFSEVKRGDAIVFNWPADNVSAIDRRTHYIKRVVGLPGETLQIRDKGVYIDGNFNAMLPSMQQFWYIYKKGPQFTLSPTALKDLGVGEIVQSANPSVVRIVATNPAVEKIRSWPGVDRVEPVIAPTNEVYDNAMYPPRHGFTPDNFGPITIPKKGETVTLNEENWPFIALVITRYEGHEAERNVDGTFTIDASPASTYTFAQDYFFAMGDNRDNSEDSRFWGFVPMDHVVGRAILIYFSWNKDSNLPRFSRLLSNIQ